MRPPYNSRCAAALLALAIALVACGSSGSNEVIVSGELAPAATPEPTTAPVAGTPVATEESAAPVDDSSSPGLVWTEVDLADALGADEHSTIRLESVGDGRVLALRFGDRGIESILVTENSTEWTPISVPAGFSPWNVDIAGDRWLMQGWDSTLETTSAQILFSDDEGASWTELEVDLASFEGTAWIANAIVAGELIVVVALHDPTLPDTEEEMVYEPSETRVHIFLSDGGPAELVADFPGWSTGGYGASDGFHLIVSGDEEDYLLTSPNGREWTTTTVDVEVTDSASNQIWTAEEGYTEYRIERFEGVYGPGQVLTLPEGVGWVVDLAVGPAGVAAVGGPESPYDYSGDEAGADITLPDIVIEKDGYELRYNQPEGGITLWDLNEDAAVYVFDAEAAQSETPPEGVREVEGEEGLMTVVFEDLDTGAEIVTFSGEEIWAAFMEADSAAIDAYDPYDFSIGWSLDGTDWEWQTIQEAFGLPQRTPDDNSFTQVQVAVGRDYVIAQVWTYEFPEALFEQDAEIGVGDGQSDSTSAYLTSPTSTSPPRWFIARAD